MKKSFGKLPLVSMRIFDGEYDYPTRERFEREWRADATVVVRTFVRRVRAGNSSRNAFAIVVRRKEVA